MLNHIVTILFLLLLPALLIAQNNSKLENQNLSLSVEGGLSIGFTDYKNQKIGPTFRTGLEYFLYPSHEHRIGLGFQFGFQQLTGEDDRQNISTKDGVREIPASFSTNIWSPGFFLDYSYLISDKFLVFGRAISTYNIFNPKDINGVDGFGYREGLYSKEFFTLIPEIGIMYSIDKHIGFSLCFNYALPVTDYLDDIAASESNDSYANIFLGISYSFLSSGNVTEKPNIEGIRTKTEGLKEMVVFDEQSKKRVQHIEEAKRDSLMMDIPTDDLPEQPVQLAKVSEILLPGDDTFQNGTSRFKPDIYPELDNILKIINLDSASRWRIEGHMDSQGVVSTIKKISQERARAIYDYFLSRGIESSRLRIYGLADNFPIGNNNSAEGRKMNRRVMIIRE